MGRYGAEDRLVSIGHKQEEVKVGMMLVVGKVLCGNFNLCYDGRLENTICYHSGSRSWKIWDDLSTKVYFDGVTVLRGAFRPSTHAMSLYNLPF